MKAEVTQTGIDTYEVAILQGTQKFTLTQPYSSAACAEFFASYFRKALALHDEEVQKAKPGTPSVEVLSYHIARLRTENDCLRKENSTYQQKVGALKAALQDSRDWECFVKAPKSDGGEELISPRQAAARLSNQVCLIEDMQKANIEQRVRIVELEKQKAALEELARGRLKCANRQLETRIAEEQAHNTTIAALVRLSEKYRSVRHELLRPEGKDFFGECAGCSRSGSLDYVLWSFRKRDGSSFRKRDETPQETHAIACGIPIIFSETIMLRCTLQKDHKGYCKA